VIAGQEAVERGDHVVFRDGKTAGTVILAAMRALRSTSLGQSAGRRNVIPQDDLKTVTGRQRGYFLSSVNLVLIVVLMVVLIFSLRLLDRSGSPEVRLSDRYHELHGRDDLSAAEQVELEMEKCRFKRDLLARQERENRRDYETARAAYQQSCAHRLPL
jgi:hypothetical protein